MSESQSDQSGPIGYDASMDPCPVCGVQHEANEPHAAPKVRLRTEADPEWSCPAHGPMRRTIAETAHGDHLADIACATCGRRPIDSLKVSHLATEGPHDA